MGSRRRVKAIDSRITLTVFGVISSDRDWPITIEDKTTYYRYSFRYTGPIVWYLILLVKYIPYTLIRVPALLD